MSKSWDSSILKKLKSLLGKGLSTAEIGKKLGMSKNAIVGKLHRLGWNTGGAEEPKKTSGRPAKVPAKKTPAKKEPAKAPVKKVVPVKKATVKQKVEKPAKKEPVKKEAPAPKAKPVGRAISGRGGGVHQRVVQHALEMANLKPNQCRWPIGDPDSEGFHFCGAPVFVGKPYCYEHCRQAYQFAPPKKK